MIEPHTADLVSRARYRAEGAKTERERIIKLITDNDVIGANWWIALIQGEGSSIYLSDKDYEQLSDAIKGEQK